MTLMLRLVGLLVGAAAVAAATLLAAPAPADPPPEVLDAPVQSVGPSDFAHCPWSLSDSLRSSAYTLAGVGSAAFDMSFLEGGRLEDRLSGRLDADTAGRVDNPRPVGASSAFVEFTEGVGSVGVVTFGDGVLAGDLCSGAVPDTWHLPGGSTLDGESLVLRLFNPFTSDARVDLWALSELGVEAGESLEGLTVPARRTRIVALDELVPRRESLSIIVRPIRGSVIPVMVLDTGDDMAVWPGSGTAHGWEFPVAGAVGMQSDLVVTNEASIPVDFLVEVFDESGAPLPTLQGRVEGPGQTRIPLEDLSFSGFGIRVTGDGPFAAVVTARSESGVGATIGAPTTASSWLVPGPGVVASGSRLRLLNAGISDLVVTYRTLDPEGRTRANTIAVPAASVRTVHLAAPEVAAVRVDAEGPLSVGWLATESGRVLLSGAVPGG